MGVQVQWGGTQVMADAAVTGCEGLRHAGAASTAKRRTMSVMSIASAGMRAVSLGVQATASNVARLPVADSTRLGIAQAATAGGGVTATVVAAPDDANAPVADLLTAKQAALAFAANATVIRRQDEMLGTLLDRWA